MYIAAKNILLLHNLWFCIEQLVLTPPFLSHPKMMLGSLWNYAQNIILWDGVGKTINYDDWREF